MGGCVDNLDAVMPLHQVSAFARLVWWARQVPLTFQDREVQENYLA